MEPTREPAEQPTPPPRQPGRPTNPWRWIWVAIAGTLLVFLLAPSVIPHTEPKTYSYSEFLAKVDDGQVKTANVNNQSGSISGKLDNGTEYTVSGPNPPIPADMKQVRSKDVTVTFSNPNTFLATWLPYLIFFGLFFGMAMLIQRQARGQMGSIMNMGKAKAKAGGERPTTTFDDVAGYHGVKTEVTEVVDFLKHPERFKAIGAEIPKGILLVGPPGTGKTLIARAVAGEAGVPFLSVSGSDFMEMFVGVGASRVRDLFLNARKQAPAIIFIDEIDSIGRKRGAGLGGGHDEREQTLNQILSEMDGFDPTQGIVVVAATNRPDILDPALLRPGRFDRQVVVPLPDQEERLPILRVHCRGKAMADDVDLELVARGTPGMSGADLANLVNEAALHAVRRGSKVVEMRDFESARDRVLMGQRRESLALSDAEKERVAYHEGGHAVLAYVLEDADPVHKVTILPTGMALGVTQQMPLEEKHIYPRRQIEDSLCVRMGGRAAELIVYGDLSTGAANDLVGSTELARRMVREWGMSAEIGPMAWGNHEQVFLGEDLMHTRDYSEETSRVIDNEVEQILRGQEERALSTLATHRAGLEAVAKALLAEESIDGETVGRLVDEAFGGPVHVGGPKGALASLDPAASPAPAKAKADQAAKPVEPTAAASDAPRSRWAPPLWPGRRARPERS